LSKFNHRHLSAAAAAFDLCLTGVLFWITPG